MSETRRRLIDWVPEGATLGADLILDRFMRYCADSGLTLYPAQEEALLELYTNHHVVLATPTGSGKSLVALGMHFKALCEGRRSFYTAPIKALASEKFFALCDAFGPENVGMLTGDASINWAAPIVCCTAEVLANMALRQGSETDAPYVAMDEFHYFADRDRGWAWQVPLLALRKTRFLLMSATLGNTAVIEEKLAALTQRRVAHVFSDERPVPLDYRYSETPIVETVEKLLAGGRGPIYIVHFMQREAALQAQGLTGAQITDRDEKRALAAAIGGFRFDSPYGKEMQRYLRFGVGLHHAGLLPKYRLLVEQLAQQGLLKVICGTDTLGVGVNIPIRTVLFTKLSKFDGEKVGILSVREFKQIAGRAGRRGFDTAGSIVCQAPEHVIENQRAATKAAEKGKARKVEKKAPPRGFVGWTRETFDALVERPPETLRSQFALSHGMLVALLQRGSDQRLRGSGYRELIGLVDDSFETPVRKRRLRREAAVLFRSLRRAGIVRVERVAGSPADRKAAARAGSSARVDAELQRDFGLHHALSLYLVDAVAALDPGSPDYAVDVISIAEAILENPRALLEAQVRVRKDELIAAWKAEGVPFEERIERLESVTWDKPIAPFLYATFELFSEQHPWVGSELIRPKSIARELWEGFLSFEDYVRRYAIARLEGVLLRYLNQVHSTLARNLPESARNDEVVEVIAYLRALLARVDSSLIEEWESLVDPSRAAPPAPEPTAGIPERAPRRLDRKAFEARIRAEMHQLLRALSQRDFETASACLAADDASDRPGRGAGPPRGPGRSPLRGRPPAARRSRGARRPLDAHHGAEPPRLRGGADVARRRGGRRCPDRGRGRARFVAAAPRTDAAPARRAKLGA
jgi:superfamily II RNA helicase